MDTKKNNVYNLYKYNFAKKVVDDVPKILNDLDKMTELCYNHIEYRSIAYLLKEINEAKVTMAFHLKKYKKVLDKKGMYEQKN